MHLNQPYEGEKCDLFAAGMIVFIMLAQHPPFGSATPKDPYYKCLALNKDELYWKAVCKNKDNGVCFFSDEFKDLFSKMVQLDPSKRLSIEEILSHPWLAEGEVASAEEVLEEFNMRNEKVKKENQE